MKTLIKLSLLIAVIFTVVINSFSQKVYNYQTVANDPLNVRIYTLDNGLKVYMSIYKDKPRIQTYIAVRTGSKNDPSDNTGISHYLEHIMFKGTEHFGTQNFDIEKPLLIAIDSLFEVYGKLTDSAQRKNTYRLIDSISGLAAKVAIANEYDKMMSAIGAEGTNAWTSDEATVYVNGIPCNQLETWLKIEYDRFSYPIFRLFHTELETVYEEKNISLDSDDDKAWEALAAGLYQKHPYGTQTTLGKVEHLKNPSLFALKNYYRERYVAGNMAICLSGDFDPDAAIVLIDKYFGQMPAKQASEYVPPIEEPITEPIVKEVFGPDAPYVIIAFRFPGKNTPEADKLTIMDMVLANNTAGLIDLNLNQAQKVLYGGCTPFMQNDYSSHIFYGYPKLGQKLEDVRDLLLSQIEEVKKGNFPDWLIPAIINDLKLQKIMTEGTNSGRCREMSSAFTENTPWEYKVNEINRLITITKQDIIDFANKNYGQNYVIVYKRVGKDKSTNKIIKPEITPIDVNRDAQSDFVKDIINTPVNDIEPRFIDFDKEISKHQTKSNIELVYRKNTDDELFNLYYVFEMGTNNKREFEPAVNYLEYLGTSEMTPAQVKQEFYKAGCNISVSASENQLWVSVSGLSENMEKGVELLEALLEDAQPNPEALKNLILDIKQSREFAKLSKDQILWSAMYNYGIYGEKSPFTNILSEKELKKLKPETLTDIIHNLNTYKHRIWYYGPMPAENVVSAINKLHRVPEKLKDVPTEIKFEEKENTSHEVYVVDYDMKQVEIVMLSRSQLFNKNDIPIQKVFNEYFGGSMGSIVFQELRESKALAYSAYASYSSPSEPDKHHYLFAYIGTQNDKLPEAMKAMSDLFNNMPESPKSFNEAKMAVMKQIRTNYPTKSEVLFRYFSAEKLGLGHDIRKDIFEKTPGFTFNDLKKFQEDFLKNKYFTILILGKKDELDISTLEKYGKIHYLTLEEIFNY